MVKNFDVSKFRKSLTKGIDGLSYGFNDPTDWISTGNYTLNYLISGDFHKGIPLGKVSIIAGEPGSGKSYISSGNLIRNAQEQDIFVILIDSENALDEKWLKDLGVDTSEEKLLRLGIAMIDDVAKVISDFMKDYKEMPQEDRPKVLFVVDSLGMLLTPIDTKKFAAGDMTGDFGHKPKQLNQLVRNSVNLLASTNVGLVCTNHSYVTQSSNPMAHPEDTISGGRAFIFAASVVVLLNKAKLRDEKKVSIVTGIKSTARVMKTRYAKPFEKVVIDIPYDKGMDPHSGLFEMLYEQTNDLKKHGNTYTYTTTKGEEIHATKNMWTPDKWNLVMEDLMTPGAKLGINKEKDNSEENNEENDK